MFIEPVQEIVKMYTKYKEYYIAIREDEWSRFYWFSALFIYYGMCMNLKSISPVLVVCVRDWHR